MENATVKYPSPKEKETFKKYWNMYILDIQDRENFKTSHLQQLKVLCDLSVEYDELHEILDLEGRTYVSEGRNGIQIKLRPEIQQINKVVSDIRNYCKALGLILVKDSNMNNTREETNEFD